MAQQHGATPPAHAPAASPTPTPLKKHRPPNPPVPHRRGWFDSRSYHHTGMISMWYAMREALAIVAEEGLEAAWARHEAAHKALWAGLSQLGLKPYVEKAEDRLVTVNTIKVGGAYCGPSANHHSHHPAPAKTRPQPKPSPSHNTASPLPPSSVNPLPSGPRGH